MYPQMSRYTIHTGEQRCSPAPFSPPPSPPKSETWSTMKSNKTFSHNSTENIKPSILNLNYGAYPYYPNNSSETVSSHNNVAHAPQHSLSYDTQLYSKTATTCENWKRQTITNDAKTQRTQVEAPSENNSNVTEKSRTELSRMSIGFMLDNSRDEKYTNTSNTPSPSVSTTTDHEAELGKEIDRRVYAGRKRRGRKNPYPMRAPSKDSPGINLVVDAYTPVMKDPAAILRSNDNSPTASPTESFCSQPFSRDQTMSLVLTSSSQFSSSASTSASTSPSTVSLFDSNNESAAEDRKPDANPKTEGKTSKERQRHKEVKVKGSGIIKPERKRKGNSLARVMTDRGLLESVFNTKITSTDIKSVRIPPPPPMQHHELMTLIRDLSIDHDILNNYTPDITWKGQPLNIAHLPHFEELHETEAKVVSVLRLTPVQYLTGKHTLVSAAKRYSQRSLPFKKSDAQKLLRIDVNKASKLWEFFHRLQWI